MIKQFNETMAATYVEYYNQHGLNKTLDFVFKTKVSLSVLSSLYEVFVKDGIAKMEDIPLTKKERYWEVSGRYFDEMADRLKASKAMYVFELITSTF